jgi:hypothetical protein
VLNSCDPSVRLGGDPSAKAIGNSEVIKANPIRLLRMVNGKVVPTRAVMAGLAKELDSDDHRRILAGWCCNLTCGFRLILLLADKHPSTVEVSHG